MTTQEMREDRAVNATVERLCLEHGGEAEATVTGIRGVGMVTLVRCADGTTHTINEHGEVHR